MNGEVRALNRMAAAVAGVHPTGAIGRWYEDLLGLDPNGPAAPRRPHSGRRTGSFPYIWKTDLLRLASGQIAGLRLNTEVRPSLQIGARWTCGLLEDGLGACRRIALRWLAMDRWTPLGRCARLVRFRERLAWASAAGEHTGGFLVQSNVLRAA